MAVKRRGIHWVWPSIYVANQVLRRSRVVDSEDRVATLGMWQPNLDFAPTIKICSEVEFEIVPVCGRQPQVCAQVEW
jgi:hypothetical protein